MSIPSGAHFDLSMMQALSRTFAAPERSFRSVHVAGTKGKGSTSTMISAALSASALPNGLYLSPHVTTLRERIQIRSRPISPALFTRMTREIARRLGARRPTFFELMTILAFLSFRERRLPWAVVEVGLGGRLDATNLLSPEASVIAPIGLDHMAVLGGTLGEIAAEKAGILKPGVPAILGLQRPEALRVLLARARRLGCETWTVGREIRLRPGAGGAFEVRTPLRKWKGLRLRMLGAHQRENAALALGSLDRLELDGKLRLDVGAVRGALRALALPGRCELLKGRPAILVDGAHNRNSVDALLRVLGTLPRRRRVLLFACQADKEAGWMIRRLLGAFDAAVFTTTGNPRSARPGNLAEAAIRGVRAEENPAKALEIAKGLAGPRGLVVAAGSLYLAGIVRKKLK